jgi:serine/threonine protein kinase
VMPLVPQNFVSLQKLNWEVTTWDWAVRLRICFRLAQAMAALHFRRGCAYCDLSTSNVLCDPASGDIKIIDTDNLTVDGHRNALGVLGTPRYIAPELQRGDVRNPGIHTDLHSLATIMFEALLLHHPLLGDRVLEGPPELEERALGAKPVYVHNPKDRSNQYTRYQRLGGLPPKFLPARLQELFAETFTHGASKPNLRVRETRWQRALADSLDLLVPCPNRKCGLRGAFLDGVGSAVACAGCGSTLRGFQVMRFFGPRQELLRAKVLKGGEWLTAHHSKLDARFDFSRQSACGRVERDSQHGLTLRNVSTETFLYRNPGAGSYAPFPPGKRVALRPGTRIQFGAAGAEGEVVA